MNTDTKKLNVAFDDKHRSWDPRFKRYAFRLMPGEYGLAGKGEMLITVLGSCVCACIRDKVTGIGGMNHFLLTHSRNKNINRDITSDYNSQSTRYGIVAMEVLINDLMKHGSKRSNLEAKIFGGAKVTETENKIGSDNIAFVKEYLNMEQIPLINSDVGGTQARTVYFIPETGDVFVRKVEKVTVLDLEKQYKDDLRKSDTDGEVYFLD
ncbi:MAG: chemoreceptor glutamine deamidase CheD [Gammaproteobacteria bacterium]|nr:MAG: chemoreceptor glutamine deamidase CheD [Gammaproteobacteria bacterium]